MTGAAPTNLRLTVAYDGTAFHGWAAQPGLRTVQGVLADALDGVYEHRDALHVAGRTDAGVHALAQVASVRVAGGPPSEAAARVLNARLPPDVAVVEAVAVDAAFHARHGARARSYRYRVLRAATRAPLDARRVLHEPRRLALDVLHAGAEALHGTHDFSAFTPAETQHVVFTRTVVRAAWREVGAELHFEVTADAFLRHQVRTLVGTMLQAARGERLRAPLAELLAGAPRALAGPTAPPWGLYLVAVEYEGEASAGPEPATAAPSAILPRPHVPG